MNAKSSDRTLFIFATLLAILHVAQAYNAVAHDKPTDLWFVALTLWFGIMMVVLAINSAKEHIVNAINQTRRTSDHRKLPAEPDDSEPAAHTS